mgnify:CR=1 FL=1
MTVTAPSRIPIGMPWDNFKRTPLCAAGVVVWFDDETDSNLIGDIITLGGLCDCCDTDGVIVREMLDLRQYMPARAVDTGTADAQPIVTAEPDAAPVPMIGCHLNGSGQAVHWRSADGVGDGICDCGKFSYLTGPVT